eukprot:4306433-Pyramimonas_sp.AAC.1
MKAASSRGGRALAAKSPAPRRVKKEPALKRVAFDLGGMREASKEVLWSGAPPEYDTLMGTSEGWEE